MQDSTPKTQLDPDLQDAMRKITPGSPQSPLLPQPTPRRATSRQQKASRAAMQLEERRAQEAKRHLEGKLRRAEERLAQASADWRLLHDAGRCWDECPECGRYADLLGELEAQRALDHQ